MASKKARRSAGYTGVRRQTASTPDVLIGISMTTPSGSTHDAEVTIHETAIGRRVDLIHVYHLWDTTFPAADETSRTNGGQAFLYCWQTQRNGSNISPTWANIASGSEDTVIDANATRIKAMSGPVYINFQNEPELLIGTPGSGLLGTAAEFVSAWQRIVDRFRAAGVTNVKWVWVVMGVMTTNQQNNAIALYPGDSYVDWISFDPYNWAAARGVAWLSFAAMVQPWYDWAHTNISATKPYMLAEYGSVEDAAAPSLQDSFSGTLALWPASAGASIVSGRARITCNTSTNSLKSAPGYVLAGGNIAAHIFPPAAGGAATSATVALRVDAPTSGTLLSIEVNRVTGLLTFASKVAFGDANQTTLTYDPVAHAWWRLRESAGTMFWETSPDGSTWTNRRTTNAATPGWVSVAGQAVNFAVKRDSGTADFAEIDDVTSTITAPPSDVTRKPDWITEAQTANTARTFPDLHALVYFDHVGSGGSASTPDGWLLSSSAGVITAYRAMALAAGPGPVDPTGGVVAMPVGNLPGWTQVIAEDFNTNFAIGGWDAAAINEANGGHFFAYNPGTLDTTQNGVYDAGTTVSVSNSNLDYYLHTIAGTPTAATIVVENPTTGWAQQYGRYSLRMRSDVMPGYKHVPLLWPDNNTWTNEVDWIEVHNLDTVEPVTINVYEDPTDNNAGTWTSNTDTGVIGTSGWHIYTMEWLPTSLTFWIDGVQKFQVTTAKWIPQQLMRLTLQSETGDSGPPTAGVSGHIQFDWVVMYEYTP